MTEETKAALSSVGFLWGEKRPCGQTGVATPASPDSKPITGDRS